MINHFNAFISYKHAELDNKIAESIVRDLEHYHIPGKIRKATGKKKIERVFRDKDELPITSDLNDTITQALANSDYLIVICSSNTKKSTWVEREIDTFLQNHSMNNILTVLADGEPYDVIPKRLLSFEKTVVDENGVSRVEKTPYEPLSCDYRLPKRRAKAEELPRLVAAIIGCAYDELINRQRQYKLHRMMTIFSGALALSVGFAGYMLYSNSLIHKNYIDSLKNQSRYLANESEQKLSEGNRIEAMQLALAALPDKSNEDKPVTPEAVKALTNASMAYVTLRGSNITASWNYKMPNQVLDFSLSDANKTLAAIDKSGVAAVWNVEDHKQTVNDSDKSDRARKLMFAGDDEIIIIRQSSISAYNRLTGEAIWKNDADINIATNINTFDLEDGNLLLVSTTGVLEKMSLKTGEITESQSILNDENMMIGLCSISEDKSRIAYAVKENSLDEAGAEILNEYNIETGASATQKITKGIIESITYIGDNIYLSWLDPSTGGSLRILNYNFMSEDQTDLYCFASGSLEEKWVNHHTSSDISGNYGFMELMNGNVLYYKGAGCLEFDAETGALKNTYNVNDAIVFATDNDNDGVPSFITAQGDSVIPMELDGVWGLNKTRYFEDDLVKVETGNGVYALGYGQNEIIFYGTKVCDDAWTPLSGDNVFSLSLNDYYICDKALLIVYPEGEGIGIYKYDPNEKTFEGQFTISEEINLFQGQILGFANNIFYIAAAVDDALKLIKFNIDTDEIETEVICDGYNMLNPICCLMGDNIIYCSRDDNFEYELRVKSLTDTSKKEDVYPCTSVTALKCFPELGIVYVAAQEDMILNIDNGEISPVNLPDGWIETANAAFDEDGNFAISNSEKILMFDKDGSQKGEISCQNVFPGGLMHFTDKNGQELLLVPYSDGTLFRYNWDTGEFIGKTDTDLVDVIKIDATLTYDDSQGILYEKLGDNLCMIDTDSWITTADIGGCIGHHIPTDTFFTYSYEESSKKARVGYFEHYTLDDLINKANNILQGMEMSEDEKTVYGIK